MRAPSDDSPLDIVPYSDELWLQAGLINDRCLYDHPVASLSLVVFLLC